MESIILFVFLFTLFIDCVDNVFAHHFAKSRSAARVEHPTDDPLYQNNRLKRKVPRVLPQQSIDANFVRHETSQRFSHDL